MKKIILSILICCFSCSGVKIPIKPRKRGQSKELQVYVEDYKKIVDLNFIQKRRLEKVHMNILPIKEEDGSESVVVGRCWYYGNGELEIVISKSFWNNPFNHDIDKRFVVYHELEHCIRYRSHTNPKKEVRNFIDFFERLAFALGVFGSKQDLPDGCPASLMDSHTLSSYCKAQHYFYYLNEMKNWKAD